MWWVNDLLKLRTRTRSERWRLVEAVFLLALMRTAIALFSFRRVASWLYLVEGTLTSDIDPLCGAAAAEIGWAIRTAAMRTPWESTCLVQTLATAIMLSYRRIPCTLCLGVAKNEHRIIAHAWLRCGRVILTGAGGHERFTTISAFSISRTTHGLIDAGGR
jgi:hypothetical protein